LKKLFLLTFLLVAPATVDAQSRFRLTVQVRSNGEPVNGATVRANSVRVLSDATGTARAQLPAGPVAIQVSRIGFATADTTISLPADSMVAIELTETAVEQEAILITSTRGERRIEEEPLRVEVVTREEVEEKLLMTPGSIAMLLNETSGLRVQETAPSLGGANVRIQGLRGKYTQLLVDGLPLYGGQTGSLGLLQVPPMDLQQVEVIKGAASALYGASALGGVVNLVPRRPAPADREVLLNATTRAGMDALVWLADSISPSWGFTFLGGIHSQNRTDVDEDAWIDIPRHRRATGRGRLFWQTDDGGSGTLTAGTIMESRRGGGTTADGFMVRRQLDTRHYDGAGSLRWLLSDALLIDVRSAVGNTSHTHVYEDSRQEDGHTSAFAETSIRGNNGRNHWVAGGALGVERYRNRELPAFDYTYTVPSLFAQDELRMADWLTIALSARLDHHSEYGTFINPRASALLRGFESWSLRLSAGTGYFPPTPFTDETEEVGLARVRPIDGLEAERAATASADLGWFGYGFEINATVFTSRIEDALGVRATGNGSAELFNRNGQTRTWGTEFLLRFQRQPLHLTLSHAYLNSTELDELDRRVDVPLTPRHTAGLVASIESEERGRASIETYYVGRQTLDDDPFRDASAPYLVVGMLFERRFGRARLFLNLENLTDVRLTDYQPFIRPSPGEYGQRTVEAWAPREGRVVNGGIRWAL
jgi:outer membrane receptor for ferrienterochelin and colicins